jgi:hypothetical protein
MKVVRYRDLDFDICQTLQIDMHGRMRAGQPLSIGSTRLSSASLIGTP